MFARIHSFIQQQPSHSSSGNCNNKTSSNLSPLELDQEHFTQLAKRRCVSEDQTDPLTFMDTFADSHCPKGTLIPNELFKHAHSKASGRRLSDDNLSTNSSFKKSSFIPNPLINQRLHFKGKEECVNEVRRVRIQSVSSSSIMSDYLKELMVLPEFSTPEFSQEQEKSASSKLALSGLI